MCLKRVTFRIYDVHLPYPNDPQTMMKSVKPGKKITIRTKRNQHQNHHDHDKII